MATEKKAPAAKAKKTGTEKPVLAEDAKVTGYRVKHGSFVVGVNQTRKVGEDIQLDEIPADQAARFVADGSLEEIAG